MSTDKIPTRRLSRKQVGEALKSMPMQAVLMGSNNSKERTLTTKQLRFAEALALGDTKAGAYRKAYNTKGKPVTQSHTASRLSMSPHISAQVEAFRVAIEAQRYATPATLRALVIERLTAAALNPENKAAQQLRALELLGKVTEVAAFTERREIIKSESPADARDKLLQSLRAAISTGDGGASLLAELSRRPSVTLDADVSHVAHDADEPEPAGADIAIDESAPPPAPAPQLPAGRDPRSLA